MKTTLGLVVAFASALGVMAADMRATSDATTEEATVRNCDFLPRPYVLRSAGQKGRRVTVHDHCMPVPLERALLLYGILTHGQLARASPPMVGTRGPFSLGPSRCGCGEQIK